MLGAESLNMFLRFENRLLNSNKKPPLHAVLLTGFVGAGKSTMLRHILNHKSNLKIAAAVNGMLHCEYGSEYRQRVPDRVTCGQISPVSTSTELHFGTRLLTRTGSQTRSLAKAGDQMRYQHA